MATKSKAKRQPQVLFTDERSQNITKVENNTGGFTFFKYLYGNHALKLILVNILGILFVAPAVYLYLKSNTDLTAAVSQLPYSNSFVLGLAPWLGVYEYNTIVSTNIINNLFFMLIFIVPIFSIGICGTFGCVRDSYWTGKLTVFKSFLAGALQGTLKLLPFFVLFMGGVFGIYHFSQTVEMVGWIKDSLVILMLILDMVVLMTGFVYAATGLLFKQSFWTGFKNSMKFSFSNLFYHMITFVFVVLPFFVLLISNQQFIFTFMSALLVMFGMIYMGLIWMIHIIRSTSYYVAK